LTNPENKYEAASLVAAGQLTEERIAKLCGVSRACLTRWKREKAFQQMVADHFAAFREKCDARSIADRNRRIGILDDTLAGLLAIKARRSVQFASIPGGGHTGLLMQRNTTVGTEYRVDGVLVRSLLAVSEQAARETGQWTEIHEHRMRRLKDLSEAELESFVTDAEKEYGAAAVRGEA